MIDEIDSHSVVQFGEGTDWCLYMFGGYINNRFLSNRIFKIQKDHTKGQFFFELDEIHIEQQPN